MTPPRIGAPRNPTTSIAWISGVGKPGGSTAWPASTTTTRRASIIANDTAHSHQARRAALPARAPPPCWALSGRVTDRLLPACPRQQDNAPSAHSALDPLQPRRMASVVLLSSCASTFPVSWEIAPSRPG